MYKGSKPFHSHPNIAQVTKFDQVLQYVNDEFNGKVPSFQPIIGKQLKDIQKELSQIQHQAKDIHDVSYLHPFVVRK